MVIDITIDYDKLTKDQQTQIGRQVQQIKRVMRKMGREQEAITIRQPKPEQEPTVKGFERITGWAVGSVRPMHLDAFVAQLGIDVCNMLLCGACKLCPAKLYRGDLDRCRKALGQYCMSDFPRGKR